MLGLSLALSSLACSTPPPIGTGLTRDAGQPVCRDAGAQITCVGEVAWSCDGRGAASEVIDCAERGQVCATGTGCVTCRPSSVRCDGETREVCVGDGWMPIETCDAASGLRCSRDGCADLCAEAREQRSYIGCEYWPVVTTNSQLAPDFSFAIVVANPQLVDAVVRVERAGEEITTRTLAPDALEIIELPWVEALRGDFASPASVRVEDGAYHVISDVPVTVSQFDPLRFRLEHDCAGETESDGVCHSFTNDASLLLPAHVLTGSYVVVSRATLSVDIEGGVSARSPGFVSIVGAAGGEIPVRVRTRSHVRASIDGAIRALAPGEELEVTVGPGDVVQLLSGTYEGACPGESHGEGTATNIRYCDTGADYDLTGTEIRANGPVAVISGHDCAFVPYDRWACDHLEEQLFPVESLGRSVLVGQTEPQRTGEPNLVRIVSAADDNTITIEPGDTPPITLDRGDFHELELRGGARITATGAILVAQFMVGQDYAGLGRGGRGAVGDPAMALAIPEEQFRTTYTFLAPDTYTESWLNVIAPRGARIVLDDTLVTGFAELGSGDWQLARVRVASGVHHVDGDRPFGTLVYGVAAYTSYLVPGGLDLRPITAPF